MMFRKHSMAIFAFACPAHALASVPPVHCAEDVAGIPEYDPPEHTPAVPLVTSGPMSGHGVEPRKEGFEA